MKDLNLKINILRGAYERERERERERRLDR